MRVVEFPPGLVPEEYPANFKNTAFNRGLGKYVGEYYGDDSSITSYAGTWPIVKQMYRTKVTFGEFIALFKDPTQPSNRTYAKLYRKAYPTGSAIGDDTALEFFQQVENPVSDGPLIDVTQLGSYLDYFVATPQNYITASDKTRVTRGVPV